MAASPDTPLVRSFRRIDELEDDLVHSWRDVSRATHRFLRLLREFDLRQGWRAYGNDDCAEWLNWRCGICRTTAQEKLRVARALWTLPKVDAAFAAGELSYSKVRALTRIATERDEASLLDYARGASASQVEAYCRRLRNGDAELSAADSKRLHEQRSLSRHFREDGSGVLTVELPRAELELVLAALERVGAGLPDEPERSLFAKGADALVELARSALAGGSEATGAASAEGYQVVVHVDAGALEGAGGEADLPLTTVRRLCCDGAVVPLVEDGAGRPLDVGRRRRTVPPALRRALLARDRHCTFPGCRNERFLEAHHVRHWADGGETSLENTLLICNRHHTLLHEGGFSIRRHPDGRRYFARPDGRPVEAPVEVADAAGADRVQESAPTYGGCAPSAEDGGSVHADAGRYAHAAVGAGVATAVRQRAASRGCRDPALSGR